MIPPGAIAYSDPVNLTIPQMADVAIDLYLPGTTSTAGPITMHTGAFQTNYVSETGNYSGAATLPVVATTQSRPEEIPRGVRFVRPSASKRCRI